MKKVKELFFQLIFSTYLHVVLLQFREGALVGWGIQFHIQQVTTHHTFGGPHSTKNEKYSNFYNTIFSFVALVFISVIAMCVD